MVNTECDNVALQIRSEMKSKLCVPYVDNFTNGNVQVVDFKKNEQAAQQGADFIPRIGGGPWEGN